ncbi:riboflavin biosynthesis protein RibF [Bacteroidales bacterium OttesenSCG-928-M11]|nr:riboflavin biosynthesis protein RibF [Bacteroidales bacterium OttesenSCG-928-M11]
MKIIYWNPEITLNENIAASIGFFDGVHKGHRFLINALKEQAEKENLLSAIITFSEHPRKVLQHTYRPNLINTLEEKLKLLSELGLDYCIVLPFSQDMANLTAAEFITDILSKNLGIKLLLVGYDHRFGKNRSEGFDQYAAYGESCGMKVIKTPALEDGMQKYSSTIIRNLLKEGEIKKAADLLSYSYHLEGIVSKGNQIGRTIGFPTANIDITDKNKLIPREGVYAVKVFLENKEYNGMLYIGSRPTVSAIKEKRIEVNIFDFNQDIYEKTIGIDFIDFIREDKRFKNINELQKQLATDKESAQNILLKREQINS